MDFNKRNNKFETIELAYKDYYNLLYNYGLKFIPNPDIVEDIIQEIFIKLCRQGNDLNIENIKTYLLRSVKNSAYDYYSSKKEIISIDEIDFIIPEDEEAFKKFLSEDEDKTEMYKRVIESIKKLPSQQKQILYLYYIKDLSHKEISEILEINVQSSMNTLARAIKKLRTMLVEKNYGMIELMNIIMFLKLYN